MKKFFIFGAFVLAAFFAVFFLFGKHEPKDFAVGSPEWKYYTAEAETKVRPESFNSMKYHEGDGPELRSPASPKDK